MTSFPQDPECPTLAELRELADGHDESLRPHVENCRRCRALVQRMGTYELAVEAGEAPAPMFMAALPARSARAGEVFGDVLIAASADAPETLLVCVVLDPRTESEPHTLEVAPISVDVAMASDFDVVLEMADPLGYPALVEVWNHGTLVQSQIAERLGGLPKAASSAVDAVFRALMGDETADGMDLSRGVAIESDEDPRAVFQEAEAERVRPFWSPAARLYSEPVELRETVGSLLSGWLARTRTDMPAYAAQLGWPTRELALLYDDAFEPHAFSPERLGMALASTGRTADDFEAALRRTITVDQFIGATETAPAQGMVFARRARRKSPGAAGSRSGSDSPPRTPAADFESYVTQAVRAFRNAPGR